MLPSLLPGISEFSCNLPDQVMVKNIGTVPGQWVYGVKLILWCRTYLKKLLNIFGVYAMNQGVNNAQDVLLWFI